MMPRPPRHVRSGLASLAVVRTLGALGTLLLGGGLARALPPPEAPQPVPSAPPARAAPVEPPVAITVGGSCPNAEAISAAIASIVPAKDLDRFASSAKAEVLDLGDTYRVSVNAKGQGQGISRLRVYRDLAHDCDHRARFAAVFIVLTLMPPEVLLDALPPPPPPAPPPPPPPPPRPIVVLTKPPMPPRRVRLELSFLADFAPRSGSPLAVALGGELRVAPGPKRLGPVGAVGIAAGSIDFGGVNASDVRLPFDLGLRLPLVTRATLDLVADVGLAGAVFRDRAKNTPDPQAGTRLDLGARAGLVMHLGRMSGRLLGIAGIHLEAFPRPYDVTLTPQGTVGHTPALWAGGTLGLAVQP
jgi:hypothetical protein